MNQNRPNNWKFYKFKVESFKFGPSLKSVIFKNPKYSYDRLLTTNDCYHF